MSPAHRGPIETLLLDLGNVLVFHDNALLFRRLATLRFDVPLTEQLDDLQWHGARREELAALCDELDDPAFLERVQRWRASEATPR